MKEGERSKDSVKEDSKQLESEKLKNCTRINRNEGHYP